MLGERFVVLGLARARAEWFRAVALWATAGAIPAEFVKCVSAEELRAHLGGGRPFSAVLLDAGLAQVDRDLLAAVRDAGCVPLVVEASSVVRPWRELGAAAMLPANFDRLQLLEALGAHATLIDSGEIAAGVEPDAPTSPTLAGRVVAVCGPGGTGASTVAMALSQGLVADRNTAGPVVLADLCRRAEQAMLHDARDVVPGMQELVEAHRGQRPSADEVHALTFLVAERGYHLLLGLRRPRYWAAIRPRSFEAAFASLRQAFAVVVCDLDADLEGEDDAGSADVEERNLMSRTAVSQADVVFAVGVPGLKGVHALVRLIDDLLGFGVPSANVVPVVNQAPRHPRQRAELTRLVAELVAVPADAVSPAPPLFLPRKRVEEALRDGVALPAPLPGLLAAATNGAAGPAGAARSSPVTRIPRRVRPGSLGTWGQEAAEG